MHEQSQADRAPRRVELSAEELSLLLGGDRFGIAEPGAAEVPVAQAPAAESAAAAATAVPDAIAAPTGSARPAGDADLVQAVLEGAPNIEQLALRIVRERTGEDLARIVTGASAEAAVATGTGSWVAKERALVVPLAPDARAAWAAWMQRWLELAAMVAARAPVGLWDDATGFPSWPRMRAQVAHRIAAARLRRECVHVSVLRVVDRELWNRRAQVLLDDAFLARAADALDAAVCPGDELGRLDDGGFVVVSAREDGAGELASALRAEIDALPGDGPRSLALHAGTATAPWDATAPDQLLELAALRAADAPGR